MRRKTLITILSGGDTLPPSCVVTSSSGGIVAGAFSVTFTFSEIVTGFAVGDIAAKQNGVAASIASNFSGSGALYTATITPTEAGTITVEVGAGVCVDTAGNANTASNTFSIISIVGSVRFMQFTNAAIMFKDAARTTPVTADGDQVKGVTDGSSSPTHSVASTTGPTYKVNIIGGALPALYFNGATPNYLTTAADIIAGGPYTRIIGVKSDTDTFIGLHGGATAASRVWDNPTDTVNFSTDIVNYAAEPITRENWTIHVIQNTGTNLRVRHPNSANWFSVAKSAYTPLMTEFMTARGSAGPHFTGYGAFDFVFPSVISDAGINAICAYENTILSNLFF